MIQPSLSVQDFLWLPVPLLALTALGLSLWLLRRRLDLHPELLRKGMHIGTGLICLCLPLWFATPWPVLTLAGVALIALLGLRLLPADGQGLASVLHGVGRRSAGELYFPLSVVALFLFSGDEVIFYLIPILVLTLADAVAALVGLRYGLSRYRAEEGYKSAEGSMAFFLVAFMATHVPLLLFTDMARLDTLLLALIIGLLVMMLEAMAWRGLDNLFIPLGTWALLQTYHEANSAALIEVLVVTVLLIVVVMVWRRRTTLTDSSLFAAILVGYAAWAVGGLMWLLPPLALFLTYTGLVRFGHQRVTHDVRAVGAITGAGLICLLAQVLVPGESFYVAWVTAFAAQLAMIGIARIHGNTEHGQRGRIWAQSTLQGWGIVVVPTTLLGSAGAEIWQYLLGGALLTGLAAGLFQHLQPQIENCPRDADRWWRQGLLGGLAALAAGVLMFAGAPFWT